MAPMRVVLLVAAGLAALSSLPAQADVTGRYAFSNTDRETGPPVELSMTVEVSDTGNFRLHLPGVPFYVLSMAGQIYLVSSAGSETQVMRAEDVNIALLEYTRAQGTGDLTLLEDLESRFSWKEVGPTTQAGWDGVSFALTFDDGPATQAPMLAVSDDPRIRPLAKPFIEVQTSFGRLLTIVPPGSKAIFERGAPLQIMFLKLVETNFAPIDESRFAIPVKPMTLDELRSSRALFPNTEVLDAPGE